MKFIFAIFLFFLPLKGFAMLSHTDTIPPNKRISNYLRRIHGGARVTGELASSFTYTDFTKGQVDSLLLVFNNDALVDRDLALVVGYWGLNSEAIHHRLCSFINLDTMDYGNKWGENRRIYIRDDGYIKEGRELGARMALAKLGYSYHIDYLDGIFGEQDVSNHHTAFVLTEFMEYLANDQLLNTVFDLTLTGANYHYMDHENHNFEYITYRFIDYLIYSLYEQIRFKDGLEKKDPKTITNKDAMALERWVLENRYKVDFLTDKRKLPSLGYYHTLSFLRPRYLNYRSKRPKAYDESTIPPALPHIRYQGICYFDGDTIKVQKLDTGDKIRLMAFKDARNLMGHNVEWIGIDGTEPYYYGILSEALDTLKDGFRAVEARCLACGVRGEDLKVKVIVKM